MVSAGVDEGGAAAFDDQVGSVEERPVKAGVDDADAVRKPLDEGRREGGGQGRIDPEILESRVRTGTSELLQNRREPSPISGAEMKSEPGAAVRLSAALLLAAAAASCTLFKSPASLPPGTAIAEARKVLGAGDEYRLADGTTRVAFRRGKDTYMLDFDAAGRLVRNQQVLNLSTFATIQPGMSQSEVLTRLGRPAFIFPVGYQRLQVWNYRFGGLEGDCMVFQVSIGNTSGHVTETGTGPDPECSRDSSRD
ncbi:MAG: hypothetical protein ABIQ33_08655 [Caldimonas sp.]